MSTLRALLGGIVDYAGLFPPAALDMPAAVRNYDAYLESGDAWMLGRFVVPVSRLEELDGALAAASAAPPAEWRVAALAGTDIEGDVRAARAFNAAHRGRAAIDVLEARLASPDAIAQPAQLAQLARLARAARDGFTVFVEVPVDERVDDLAAVLGREGLNAKIRTGGVTADAIPSAWQVVRFIRACLRARVPFKATAGLHHPIRADYRLTYAPDSPTGVMFGYLNVFLAAALMAEGLDDADAVALLEEARADAFERHDDAVSWRGHVLATAAARRVRERVAVSFGSCSFREPVDELDALGLAPA